MIWSWWQKVDILAHARTAHKGLLQDSLEEDLCWIVPYVPPTTQSVAGLNYGYMQAGKQTAVRGVAVTEL